MNRIFLLVLASLFVFVPTSDAADFGRGNLFKIKLITSNEEVECEYRIPNSYKCRKDGNEFEDRIARKQLLLLYRQVHPIHGAKVEDIVTNLENEGYSDIEYLDVRWIDDKGRLSTWVWERGHQG